MPDTLIKGYEELENKFFKQVKVDRNQNDDDDIVYLPAFLKPTCKVKCVFISMEPSLTKGWANPLNRSTAEAKIRGGFRNFAPGRFEDAIIHYCAQNYLDTDYQNYYITDMSKGAMPPKKADEKDRRNETWINWFSLLKEELELVAEEDAQIFAIGRKVQIFLLGKTKKKGIPPEQFKEYNDIVDWIEERFHGKPTYLLHHAPSARPFRGKYITENGLENDYAKYELKKDDLLVFAEKLLSDTHANTKFKKTCMDGLKAQNFNDSLKKLAFVYKHILTPHRTG